MSKVLRIGWLALALFATAAAPALAQTRATTADLTGVVQDQSQAVLPGVIVTATNEATGLVRSATTEGDGRFTIPAIAVGTYTVTAELPGFATQKLEKVVLTLGGMVDLEVSMKIAGTAEEITVLGETPLVDTQKVEVSTTISQQQIEALPINGRNFISFSVITPGVSTDRTPQQGAAATSGLTFAGQRARSNNITVDGLDNNDAALGAVRATFSQEAVREFQVITNSYSAEFGKASGGVVNIVTKSGTNTLSGNAFLFFRDESLNSRKYFERFDSAGNAIDRDKAPYSQKQFGGTLGGPLQRDKSFFFLSYERLNSDANNFVTIDDTTNVNVFGTSFGTPAAILRRAGFAVDTGNNPFKVKGNEFLAKTDHQLTQNQSLTLRFNYANALNENIEPFGGIVARSRGALLDSKDYMLAASHTAVLSSRMVNELRFQYARRDQDVNSLDPTCGGPCDADDQGGPTVEVPGVASVGRQRFTPQPRNNRRYQFLDSASYYVGDHQFKTGFDFSYIDNVHEALPLHFGGRYIFQAVPAALAPLLGLPGPITGLEALALNLPLAYVQGYGNPSASYGVSDLSLFVQDDWRLSQRFTVKAGVRYQNQFWPDTNYHVAGIADYTFPADHNNIAPRLAVAWDPAGDKKTTIHGSYGIFFDNQITAINGITDIVDGDDNVRTLVLTGAGAIGAWRTAPGRKLPQAAAPANFPSLEISIDPGLQTPYAHHVSFGVERELPGQIGLSASFVYARGFHQLSTIDYNPVINAAGGRPEDVNGVPGTSASILQYTSFGETWYRGLTMSVNKRFNNRYQFLASYTLSRAEDNSTDFQSNFIPQSNGQGRNDADPTGLPVGFDPDTERGASTQDQRHRFVLSGLYVAPWDIQLSTILTAGSGRPFNILAGSDLNGDRDGGAFPSDRARTNPADAASSVERNAGTLPSQAIVDIRVMKRFRLGSRASIDGIFETFNLFNRTNFVEINNIFGSGAFPTNPLPTYGQFTVAAPPRQIQLALKVNF